MKKLKTCLLAILLSAGFTMTSNAQGSQIGVNMRTGVPVGDFADYAGFGLGGGMSYNFLVNNNFGVGLDVGYMTFLENDLSDFVTGSSVVVPMIVNARYTFGETGFRPFIGVGLGYSIVQQTTTVRRPNALPTDENDEFFVRDFDEEYSGMTIVPHIGFSVMMNESTSMYLTADYTYILNEAQVEVYQDTPSGGPTGGGGATTIALDPYAYVGINLGMMYTIGE